ncbi:MULTISPECIES: type 1 glutamine amidotransferase domain-containing protein [Corynebacterium]|uniref:type 1 glutamine amidotransferase domain-containing protein n=1 Tax=Corynebacterium TaxID=1716 RepID=UPI00254FB1DF|nr:MULTISPECIES: type 1 glutamine amidotransferase domain-containing protein [Corynebacterium]MDK6259506.1 type 1 glutamine amidotransferase domain-containing protein [Corynebacterium frankenforstense]MDK8895069.1 type 1 glutamine amidotransferase domain-containing protein [Corynebacterium sp. MSK006]
MGQLDNVKVAVVATNDFEDSELTSPVEAVKSEGAEVKVVSTESGTITGKKGAEVTVDLTTADAKAEDFDALILPGGTNNADIIRTDENAVALVRGIAEAGKPIGAICHGPWILADADALRGRTVTSFKSLKTDLTNAGATWVDSECECDQGLVTSRTPDDLPAFNAKIVEEFAEGIH